MLLALAALVRHLDEPRFEHHLGRSRVHHLQDLLNGIQVTQRGTDEQDAVLSVEKDGFAMRTLERSCPGPAREHVRLAQLDSGSRKQPTQRLGGVQVGGAVSCHRSQMRGEPPDALRTAGRIRDRPVRRFPPTRTRPATRPPKERRTACRAPRLRGRPRCGVRYH
jgi:hypothetical protein